MGIYGCIPSPSCTTFQIYVLVTPPPVSVSSSLETFSRSCPGLLGVVEQGDLGGDKGWGGWEGVGSLSRRAQRLRESTTAKAPKPASRRCISLGRIAVGTKM